MHSTNLRRAWHLLRTTAALVALGATLTSSSCDKDEEIPMPPGGGVDTTIVTPPPNRVKALEIAPFETAFLFPPDFTAASSLIASGSRAIMIADKGIYTSDDRGDSWALRQTVPDLTALTPTHLQVSIGDELLAFAGTGGFYGSDDKGTSWTPKAATGLVKSGNAFPNVRSVTVATDGDVYVVERVGGQGAVSIYRSADRGASFTVVKTASQSRYDPQVVAYGQGAVLYNDGERVYRSEDDGQTWTSLYDDRKPTGGLWADPISGELAFSAGMGIGARLVRISRAGAVAELSADLRILGRTTDGQLVATGRYTMQYLNGNGPGEAGENLWRFTGIGPEWIAFGTLPQQASAFVTIGGRRLAISSGQLAKLDAGAAQWRFSGLVSATDVSLAGFRKAVISGGHVMVSPDGGATWLAGRGFSSQDQPTSVLVYPGNGDIYVGTDGPTGRIWHLDLNGAGTQGVYETGAFGIVDLSPSKGGPQFYFAGRAQDKYVGTVGIFKLPGELQYFDAPLVNRLGDVMWAGEAPAGYAVVSRGQAEGTLARGTFFADNFGSFGEYQVDNDFKFPKRQAFISEVMVEGGRIAAASESMVLYGPDTVQLVSRPTPLLSARMLTNGQNGILFFSPLVQSKAKVTVRQVN